MHTYITVSVCLYWTYSSKSVFDIHVQSCSTGIEPARPSSADRQYRECVNHSATDAHKETEQQKVYRQTVQQCHYSPENHI